MKTYLNIYYATRDSGALGRVIMLQSKDGENSSISVTATALLATDRSLPYHLGLATAR